MLKAAQVETGCTCVAKGESSDRTRSQTRVSRVLNVQLDHNDWQSQCILKCSDSTPLQPTKPKPTDHLYKFIP